MSWLYGFPFFLRWKAARGEMGSRARIGAQIGDRRTGSRAPHSEGTYDPGVSDFDETHGSSVNARMASHAGEGPTGPVDDRRRAAIEGDPPVPGAQWDELHRRWERWDEETEAWVVVGDAGDGVAPLDENPLPPLLDRELHHADELATEQRPVVADVSRAAASGPAPRGAQWNEVAGRWERWDEDSEAWVEARVDPEG